MNARKGLWLAPFGELADPVLLADLAERAEASGWHGVFLWDHVEYASSTTPIADPWIALAAMATRTQSVLLGTLVTPVPRRHVHKLARETATLDGLSGGRLILGVGLGDGDEEHGLDPALADPTRRARSLDTGLDRLTQCWAGHFHPVPRQSQIPVWVGSVWPHRRPLRRAAHWDGWFPVGLSSPDDLVEGIAEIHRHRPSDEPAPEIVVSGAPGADPRPWERAGATWWLSGFGAESHAAQVESVIDAGP